jgi:plasmid maintenance system antidote protein VapI
MKTTNKRAPISDLLRRTVAEAVEQGLTNYLALERETGVQRASIRRFASGERTLRLDVADKLAFYFKLELQLKRKGR